MKTAIAGGRRRRWAGAHARAAGGAWLLFAVGASATSCSSGLTCAETQTCPPPHTAGQGGAAGMASAGAGGKSPAGSTSGRGGSTNNGGGTNEGGAGGSRGGTSGTAANGGSDEAGAPNGDSGSSSGTAMCGDGPPCDDGDDTNGLERCVDGSCEDGDPPPRVAHVTPADAGEDIEPDAAIEVEFSEDMDPASIEDSLELRLNGKAVEGEWSYADGTASFTPKARLTLLGDFTISVKKGVQDLDGARMVADFTSTFSVRDGQWAPPMPVTVDDSPVTAIDAAGNVLVAWPAQGDAFARWYHPGTGWEDPVTLDSCTGCTPQVNVAMNGVGVAIVTSVIRDGDTSLVNARQYRNGAWDSTPQPFGPWSGPRVVVGMSPDGQAHLAIAVGDQLITRHTDTSGSWGSEAQQFGSVDPGLNISFSPDGNGYLLWRQSETNSIDQAEYHHLWYARYSAAQEAWTPSQEVPGFQQPTLGSGRLSSPALALAPSGEAMTAATFVDGSWLGGTKASHFTNATGWSAGEEIDDLDYQGMDPWTQVSLACDGEDFVATWAQATQQSSYSYNLYSNRYHDDAWGDAELRSDGLAAVDTLSALTSDAAGNLLLAWSARIGSTQSQDLLFSRYSHGAWAPAKKVLTMPVGGGAKLRTAPNGISALTTAMSSTYGIVIFE